MRAILIGVVVVGVGVAGGCSVSSHLTKEIPPPGGCDRCHTQKIGGDWTVSITPVRFGRDGGVVDDRDIAYREVVDLPVHAGVPAHRLKVSTEGTNPETVGDPETGIQCFACHRSPGPPHGEVRGQFPHPWGKHPKAESGKP